MCVWFDDGYANVNDSWIKEKLNEKSAIFFFLRHNAYAFVAKEFSKDVISKWKFFKADIECYHGNYKQSFQNSNNL